MYKYVFDVFKNFYKFVQYFQENDFFLHNFSYVNKSSSCVYTNRTWVDFGIICSVNVSLEVSFQFKIMVKWIFPLSITIDYYRWKIFFPITLTISQKLTFWSSVTFNFSYFDLTCNSS